MKIAYDVSILGMGNLVPHVRTGIFRYVENLAYGLANAQDCDLAFFSLRPMGHRNSSSFALDYLQNESRLAEVPFINPPFLSIKRVLDRRITDLSGAIGDSHRIDKLHYRACRRLLDLCQIAINLLADVQLPQKLTHFDLVHGLSNFPLPKRVRSTLKPKRFVTIYDLIPIMFPGYFDHDAGHLLHKVVGSVQTDGWALCISQSTRNDLLNHFKRLDPRRVAVTYLAASELFFPCKDDLKLVDIRRKYGIPPDAQYLLSVATLEPRKNLECVIDSFGQFVRESHNKDLNLVLVGTPGWKYDKIFARISQEDELRGRIIVTGYVRDLDLAPLYSGALAFVYLSLYEGFGLPPLEAMQCGVPVIVSNTSAFPEIVADAGWMLDPTDRDGICHAMGKVYSSASIREVMARKSLQRAEQFSWANCTRDTIAAYKQALSS